MRPPIPSFPLRILSITSALIAFVGLFVIVDLRSSRRGQQATQRVPTRRSSESSSPVLVPQVLGARDVVAESASNQPKQNLINAYGKLPMSFEVNDGQTDKQVRFLSHGAGYGLFLTPAEALLALR